jgi:hypothetical protein
VSGDTCSVCFDDSSNDILEIMEFADAQTFSIGYAGEIFLATLGIGIICGFVFLFRRSKTSLMESKGI